MGATINAHMGLNTWAAFFGTDTNAEIAGDVAMLAQEVTPVLKALRANGLGAGPTEKLARRFQSCAE